MIVSQPIVTPSPPRPTLSGISCSPTPDRANPAEPVRQTAASWTSRQTPPAAVRRHPGARAGKVPVRRPCRARPRRLLHRRVPAHHDSEILPIPGLQFDVGLPDVEAHLDRDSLRHGWEPDTVVGIGDVTRLGEPCSVDPRQVLRAAVEPWRAMGLEPQVAFELEFYLCEPDEDGGWRPVSLPPTACTAPARRSTPAAACTTWSTAPDLRVPAGELGQRVRHVGLRGQHPLPRRDPGRGRVLSVPPADPRGRRPPRQARHVHGRPFNDRGGSGLHLNVSFRRPDGSNALHDPSGADGLSDLARRCIAGILEHHTGMAAVFAPSVNAYKRLQPDMLNGYWANWGHDDRSVTVRVPSARGEATRLEQRTSDGAANPYLAAAALLHAARYGTEHELEPPPPQPVGEEPATDVRIPANLRGAAGDAGRRPSCARPSGPISWRRSPPSRRRSGSATSRRSKIRTRPTSPTGSCATTCPSSDPTRFRRRRGRSADRHDGDDTSSDGSASAPTTEQVVAPGGRYRSIGRRRPPPRPDPDGEEAPINPESATSACPPGRGGEPPGTGRGSGARPRPVLGHDRAEGRIREPVGSARRRTTR